MMDLIGPIIGIAVGIGVAYVIFKETGVEGKIKRIQQQKIKQTEGGWGREEAIRLTDTQAREKMKTGKKVNKKLFVGMDYIGKVVKTTTIKTNPQYSYLVEIKKSGVLNSLFGKGMFFIVDSEEITHQDKNNVYLIEKPVFNQQGIFYLIDEVNREKLKSKKQYIDFLLDKMNYEDAVGRISNLATKVSYLDVVHAQRMDELNKKIESIEKARESGGKEVGVGDILGS